MSLMPSQKVLVGPEGPIDAKIAFVGEAPGETEVRIGRPFVGRAGGIFEECLHNAGIARAECYITNVIKERPYKNNIAPFYNEKKGLFTKAGDEYVKELREELLGIEANVIVPLGNCALTALTGRRGVQKLRGSVLESTLLPGKKIIPTIHPSAINKEYLFRYPVISDMRRIRGESHFPDIRRVDRRFLIDPSYDEAIAYLDDIRKNYKKVSVDIEVVNQQMSCIGFAKSPTDAMCLPFIRRDGGLRNRWAEQEEAMLMLLIAEILEREDITIIGQNVYTFDAWFMMKESNIITQGRIEDTMIGHHVVYYDFPKGLDFLTSIYEREPYYKDEGKVWKNPLISDVKFWTYCAKDAAVEYGCWNVIEKEIDKKGVRETYEFTLKLLEPLVYMQLRGIKSNKAALTNAKNSITISIREKQAELDKMCGGVLNTSSNKQMVAYFYGKKGITPYTNRQSGNPTYDEKALSRMARKGVREAYLILELRKLRTMAERYLDIELDPDERLRSSYDPTGTRTGRISSSQTIFGTGTNFQNIPPKFKVFLEADDDMVLVEIDKRQAEWLDVAYLSGDANMIEVAEKGIDAHIRTAHLMFQVPEEMIKREAKIIGGSTDSGWIRQRREEMIPEILQYDPPHSMSCRQAGKKSNHSFDYRLSPDGFSFQYLVELKEAKRCYILYHGGYPGIKQWYQQTEAKLSEGRTLTNFFGRKRVFMDRWGDDLFKAAQAYVPQSDIGDLLNWGIIKIYHDNLEKYMREIDQIGQVHDSLLIQYPVDRLYDLAQALLKCKEHMEPTMSYRGRDFVIPTDLKIGFNWFDMTEVKYCEDPWELKDRLTDGIIKSIRS